jgi:uncharacterized protein
VICPNENIEMRQVKIESHYGQSVILDQCPSCGGIWFDKSELYMAKQGQADKIELIDVNNLRIPSAIENCELLCPKDRTKLILFKDPYFPKAIIIARCPVCEGFWLNRGEFAKYQQFRQNKLGIREITEKEIKLEQEIEQILENHKSRGSVDTLGRLGTFLSTPLDQTSWRPQESAHLSDKEINAFNIILNALAVILRLFIRI